MVASAYDFVAWAYGFVASEKKPTCFVAGGWLGKLAGKKEACVASGGVSVWIDRTASSLEINRRARPLCLVPYFLRRLGDSEDMRVSLSRGVRKRCWTFVQDNDLLNITQGQFAAQEKTLLSPNGKGIVCVGFFGIFLFQSAEQRRLFR